MPSISTLQDEFGRTEFTLAVVLVLFLALLGVATLRRRGRLRSASVAASVGFVVVVAGVLSLTLVGDAPPGAAPRRLLLDPLEGAWGWDSIAWRPVYDNIALFVPVGAVAVAVWWRRSPFVVWLACVAFSIGIETFQFVAATGRVANSADVLANGTGAAFGLLLAMLAGVRAGPHHDRSLRGDADARR